MDEQILAALDKFHDVWPRVGGGLEVANRDYAPPGKIKTPPVQGRRYCCGTRLWAVAILIALLLIKI